MKEFLQKVLKRFLGQEDIPKGESSSPNTSPSKPITVVIPTIPEVVITPVVIPTIAPYSLPNIVVTKEMLKAVSFKATVISLQELADGMNKYFPMYGITSKEQVASFIAQTAHETGGYRWLTELGDTSYFSKYEPGTSIGTKLGNTNKGDGALFKGRGLIQLTGRYNYMKFGDWYKKSYGMTFEAEEVAKLPLALLAALWYWDSRKLQNITDMVTITKKINGGVNGLTDRLDKYKTILNVL